MIRALSGLLFFIVAVGQIPAAAQPSANLDPSFGAGGWLFYDGGLAENEEFKDVAVQPDGRILLVGTFTGHLGFLLVRVDESGALDPSFGTDGVVRLTFAPWNEDSVAEAVALQPDGKILVAGRSSTDGTSTDFTVCRLSDTGALDLTFGSGGCAFSAAAPIMNWGVDLALLPDGSVVVAGTTEFADKDLMLSKFTSSGVLDASFGVNGITVLDVGGDQEFIRDIELEPVTGDLIVVGRTRAADYNIFTARFSPDGTPDAAFGTNGVVVENLGAFDDANAVLCVEGGKIVTAGYKDSLDSVVLRYNEDGTRDTTFGTNGLVLLDWDIGGFPVNGLTRGPDGTLFVVGQAYGTTNDVGLAAFDATGAPVVDFGVGGAAAIDSGGTDLAYAIVMDPAGRLVIAGAATTISDGFALRVLALDADVVFWDGFEPGTTGAWSSSLP